MSKYSGDNGLHFVLLYLANLAGEQKMTQPCAFHSGRGHIERPGQNETDDEADDEESQDQSVGPVWHSHDGECHVDHLQHDPRYHEVDYEQAHDVTSAKLTPDPCQTGLTPRHQGAIAESLSSASE